MQHHRWTNRWTWILGLALSASAFFTFTSARATGDAPALPLIAATTSGAGDAAIRAGDSAVRKGDYQMADHHYRAAWKDPRSRHLAADRLTRLHQQREFTRPVNTQQLEKTLDALGPSFRVHESDYFVMLTDAPTNVATARLDLLDRARQQFFRVMDRLDYPAAPPEHKLLCIFFATHHDYVAFARSQDGVETAWIAGYYAGVANRIVFYDDSTSPAFNAAFNDLRAHELSVRDTRQEARDARRNRQQDHAEFLAARADDMERRIASERRRLESEARYASDAKTIHEAVHLLAFNCHVQSRAHEYPFWLTEGLASAFETERPNAAFGPDKATPGRQAEYDDIYTDDRLMPLEDLVRLAKVPSDDHEVADVMYAQSQALFAYLYRYHRRSLSNFMAAIHDEAAGQSSSRRRLALFEEHFGSVQSMETRMLKRTAP